MNNDGRRCLVLVDISNGYRMERHITEIEVGAIFNEVVHWVRTRDSYLDDDLRGKWTYADVYIVPADGSIDQKRYAMTIRNRRGKLEQL